MGRKINYSGNVVAIGVTGSVGPIGNTGTPFWGQDFKEISILCIKDSGFFNQGEYYKVLLLDNDSSGENPWRRITITSTDKLDTKVFKPEEFDSIFLYGDKLRDKKLNEILNDTI